MNGYDRPDASPAFAPPPRSVGRAIAGFVAGTVLLGWLYGRRANGLPPALRPAAPPSPAAAPANGAAAPLASASASAVASAAAAPHPMPGLRPDASMPWSEVAQRFWSTVKRAAVSWADDYAASMGAALSYYTLFSIGPLLLIVVSVAGLAFGQDAARGEILAQLEALMGRDGAAAVAGLLKAFDRPETGLVGAAIGIVALVIGATSVFGELQDALDRIWRAPARPPGSGLWRLLRARLLSFGMVLSIGFLLIVSLVLSAVLAAVGRWWEGVLGGWPVLAQVLDAAVSFGLMTLAFAMIYKIMPRVRIRWFDVWIGAAFTALLFVIGKSLIGVYIGRSGVVSGFGAASSIVVLLVWVYYSAQVFLLGAEFTWVFSHTFGSRRHLADAVETPPPPLR